MVAKIVHLIGQMGRGGAERQLLHLAGALQARGWPQVVVSFGGGDEWNGRLAGLRIPLYEIPRTAFKPWRLWQLARIIQREKPAILHTWSWNAADYASWAWGKAGARTIYGLRTDLTVDLYSGDPARRLLRMRGLERSDYAVGNSRQAFENLERRGV